MLTFAAKYIIKLFFLAW